MIKPNMGTKRAPHSLRVGLADALFSLSRQRVLALLFGQPFRSFYTAELISLACSGSGAVQRELSTLLRSGLITVTPIGNQKHYQANAHSPLFDELCSIVRKTVGLAEPLRQALDPLTDRIAAAFVYGSVARRAATASSDIDLMIVADHLVYGDVFLALEAVGEQLGRPVNPTILSPKDIARRRRAAENFIVKVFDQPKIWIIGSEHDIPS